ncbi:FtsX-like permease family protein [Desulforhopalus singaporensis]|uniref:MacB-like core domain-containing protein n=1 Tax=Desulforhopalus singaporensis TaxID=91360 RepID=A0A1H0M6T9_9BACT|nr:FtsX-like permease family protein [Desulforhopalus singaporensis]SDO76077.1 MacB-like core domain-containing protein [Desulforhopalus singaporensis]
MIYLYRILVLLIFFGLLADSLWCSASAPERENLEKTIHELSSYSSRTTGSGGYEKAADYIEARLRHLSLSPQNYLYDIPVRRFTKSWLTVNDQKYPLHPFIYNAVTPEATDGAFDGPVFYCGRGLPGQLDGKRLKDSIVLLDFDSARNWQLLASLGAKAVIYLYEGKQQDRIFYKEKSELTPIQFPCFWMKRRQAQQIFGNLETTAAPLVQNATLFASARWERTRARNIYALIEGGDAKLKNELLIVESFFDSEEFVAGLSPGADAASSIATFLEVAEQFTKKPPGRSVLLVASSGQFQTLAGMRDIMWSLNTRSKDLRTLDHNLKKQLQRQKKYLKTLDQMSFPLAPDATRDNILKQAINHDVNQAVDRVSRRLMQLRLADQTSATKQLIKETAAERFLYRRLGWTEDYSSLPAKETKVLNRLIVEATDRTARIIADLKGQASALSSAKTFRNLVRDYDVAAVVSLYLSSHGSGVGAFNRGWLYNLKSTVNRSPSYTTVASVLRETGAGNGNTANGVRYHDTLRPDSLRTWDSWFIDRPAMGGEVSSLAGYLGLSLVTTDDARPLWGTPEDQEEQIDWNYLAHQAQLVRRLLYGLGGAPRLHENNLPRDGLVTVTVRANLLLQGELFATYPAHDTTILGYQGLNRFYAMVDETGYFTIKGLADKKHVLDKLIIEGYRFDSKTGKVIWAIDKKETGKANYRLKLLRKSMQSDLVMFNCRETTLFDLLEPRTFAYMTKLHLFDGRRDAPPEHYWYSRIDTRESIISSIYTAPGTLLKLTLSDTVLTTKMILSNGTDENRMGLGYPVDDFPTIPNTIYHAAKDAWTLLEPRIVNLENHGIFDPRINELRSRGLAALDDAEKSLDALHYSRARTAAATSQALAERVYVQVEKTQKDVLFGVLFYIALFVPFAFVTERFLFNFNNIYKRIAGFFLILAVLIAVIYNVHPAFELAYSPMVVILAFFVIGLSFIVSLIIFFRFEDEMILLQRRAAHKRSVEISRWKAFTAAFFLGVSNLRRRRLRTVLTCSTLVILTFTIMSFTTIKSNKKQVRLPFSSSAPYRGLLLRQMNNRSLPPQATEILMSAMSASDRSAPRVWIESQDPSRPVHVSVRNKDKELGLQGLIGLSPDEPYVTGLDRLLTAGRWFNRSDIRAIILEKQTADLLGVAPDGEQNVSLWGIPFTVIGTFDAKTFAEAVDLDGEPLTPVIFPNEADTEMTEEELEAMESGDDVRSFQSRYIHIPAGQTAIIPAQTLAAAGGRLKNIAVRPANPERTGSLAGQLSDRFSLAIFTGEPDGVWLYNISDTMNYSGVPNIIIPLLISILIVLNTMISAVHERKNEIGVYTSVGLAPSHVGFLFVAEAMALAVISVVLGYLIAQVLAALLSTTALWSGITVNYSSMAGVASMILVILVVLISVIYPSRVAARIAIPDVHRTFKLPLPENDRITVTLPFLMKFSEHESIGGFIYQYLESHRDISHGLFSSGPIQIVFSCSTVDEIIKMVKESDAPHQLQCLHIRSKIWLAPFDFGIMQTADLQFCPAREGEEFLEIKITLHRQSGESAAWHRLNVSFLHEIRKQLLIWRSLDQKTHAELGDRFRTTVDQTESQLSHDVTDEAY